MWLLPKLLGFCLNCVYLSLAWTQRLNQSIPRPDCHGFYAISRITLHKSETCDGGIAGGVGVTWAWLDGFLFRTF